MTRVPVTTTYVMTFAPGKTVVDLQYESTNEDLPREFRRD